MHSPHVRPFTHPDSSRVYDGPPCGRMLTNQLCGTGHVGPPPMQYCSDSGKHREARQSTAGLKAEEPNHCDTSTRAPGQKVEKAAGKRPAETAGLHIVRHAVPRAAPAAVRKASKPADKCTRTKMAACSPYVLAASRCHPANETLALSPQRKSPDRQDQRTGLALASKRHPTPPTSTPQPNIVHKIYHP